ncbi:hypothetical protein [Nonlabens ulvanivorans]|uniref:hypothetical protein n=1 Tax=Nonlabens ulvanivorans TaxID=906888 RepID=UPI0037C5A4D5
MLILQQDKRTVMDYVFNIAGTLAIASALFYIIYSDFFKDRSKNQWISNETINTFDLLTQRKELQQYLTNLFYEDSNKNRSAVIAFDNDYVQYAIYSRRDIKSRPIYCEASSGDFNKTVIRTIEPNYSLLLKNGFSKELEYKSNYSKEYDRNQITTVEITEELFRIMEKVYHIDFSTSKIIEITHF